MATERISLLNLLDINNTEEPQQNNHRQQSLEEGEIVDGIQPQEPGPIIQVIETEPTEQDQQMDDEVPQNDTPAIPEQEEPVKIAKISVDNPDTGYEFEPVDREKTPKGYICAICIGFKRDVTELPCGHSYCRPCLVPLMDKK